MDNPTNIESAAASIAQRLTTNNSLRSMHYCYFDNVKLFSILLRNQFGSFGTFQTFL